jgi:[acyl-carrier-protein] S-malonyltransferase
MVAEGVDTFVEIGPGKVLSGLIKKTDKEVNVINIEDMATLEAAVEFLRTV